MATKSKKKPAKKATRKAPVKTTPTKRSPRRKELIEGIGELADLVAERLEQRSLRAARAKTSAAKRSAGAKSATKPKAKKTKASTKLHKVPLNWKEVYYTTWPCSSSWRCSVSSSPSLASHPEAEVNGAHTGEPLDEPPNGSRKIELAPKWPPEVGETERRTGLVFNEFSQTGECGIRRPSPSKGEEQQELIRVEGRKRQGRRPERPLQHQPSDGKRNQIAPEERLADPDQQSLRGADIRFRRRS